MSSRLRSQKWIVSAALISSVVSCGDPPANTDDVVEDDDPRPPDAAPVDAVGSEPDAPIPPDGTVVIVPATPRTLDDLTAQVTSDEPAAFTLRWFENGVERTDLTTDTVGNPETTKADVWRVELVRDGGEVASSFEVTIANTPPTAPVVAVPETAATTADIPCSIIEPATDADGDAIVYSASWTVNAAAYLGATASTSFDADTVLAEGTALDDQFVCTVTASDGADSSTGMSEVCEVVCGEVSIATTFTFTGTEQTVVVPECATSMVIEAWGAQGGGPGGGNGGYARGTSTTITEGDTFYVYVGGREGYNGGGTAHAASPAHGGGASDVRSVAGDLASRLIVAGRRRRRRRDRRRLATWRHGRRRYLRRELLRRWWWHGVRRQRARRRPRRWRRQHLVPQRRGRRRRRRVGRRPVVQHLLLEHLWHQRHAR
jgi:hypothetical protein